VSSACPSQLSAVIPMLFILGTQFVSSEASDSGELSIPPMGISR
jgi:hypothetical protein